MGDPVAPLVPAAMANLPNGNVLMWSASQTDVFTRQGKRTETSLFDPSSRTSTRKIVTETQHEMFCPGTSNLADGSILVAGGSDGPQTSIYQPSSNTWTTAAAMNIARGYQGNTVLHDGSVLTLGGSWDAGSAGQWGTLGGKHGERWTSSGWLVAVAQRARSDGAFPGPRGHLPRRQPHVAVRIARWPCAACRPEPGDALDHHAGQRQHRGGRQPRRRRLQPGGHGGDVRRRQDPEGRRRACL